MISYEFTEGLDPTQFHCVRYSGPLLKSDLFDKNEQIYAFSSGESPEKVIFTAPLAFTWTEDGAAAARLILPSWMKSLVVQNGDFLLSFNRINPLSVIEYSGVLKLNWICGLEAIDARSFPFEEVFPRLFEEKRPLVNGTVLSFLHGGMRFLLKVTASELLDGVLFWFNLNDGSFEFPALHSRKNDSLQILLEKSWNETFSTLQYQLKQSRQGKGIFLLTGVPGVFQEDLFEILGRRYKMINVQEVFPEEHFELPESSGDEGEYEEMQDDSFDFYAASEIEKYSTELMSSLLRRIRSNNHRLTILTSESSSQLVHLERTARQFRFQLQIFQFPVISEAEKAEILLKELGGGARLCEAIEKVKWIFDSLSMTQLFRLARCFQNIDDDFEERRLCFAVNEIKKEINDSSLSSGIEELKGSGVRVPFYGYSSLVKELKDLLSGPLLHREAYERFNLPLSSGYLLHGPAGCGKTSLCLNLLCGSDSILKDNFNIIHVPTSGQLLSKYFGETEANIRRLFVRARERKPCVLFIDQIETLGRKRGGIDDEQGSARYLSTLLNEMDGITGNEGVTILACATDISMLDEALLRPGRLDRHFLVDLPNFEDRAQIIQGYHRAGCTEISPANTEGLNAAEIKSLVYSLVNR